MTSFIGIEGKFIVTDSTVGLEMLRASLEELETTLVDFITWGTFKQLVEDAGVTDETFIDYIEYYGENRPTIVVDHDAEGSTFYVE